MPKVAIIQRIVPYYRGEFFNGLRRALEKKNIELLLLYGEPNQPDGLKRDTIDLEWATKVPSKTWRIGHYELCWQPVLRHLKGVDLVIVEQAAKLLINYLLLIQYKLGIRKMAFWGHGKNFQESSVNISAEWIKRTLSTNVHWWFAYNELSASVVRSLGFPPERITNVQNAIDTRSLTMALKSLTPQALDQLRDKMGIESANIACFIGGMYPGKHLPFLLESCKFIRKQVPDFEMIYIGSGVDARIVREAAETHSWIHYIGPKFGDEKVPYVAISKVILIPGSLGLVILDAFALETPIVTMKGFSHGPEIDYLQSGINGVAVEGIDDIKAYAEAVVLLLSDEPKRQLLVKGCHSANEIYTVEHMIECFVQGIELALDTD